MLISTIAELGSLHPTPLPHGELVERRTTNRFDAVYFLLPTSYFLLPTSYFLLSTTTPPGAATSHPVVVGNVSGKPSSARTAR